VWVYHRPEHREASWRAHLGGRLAGHGANFLFILEAATETIDLKLAEAYLTGREGRGPPAGDDSRPSLIEPY